LYALVTPARNEATRLPALASALTAQTLLPTAWVIVDDGSSDGTGELAEELAREHAWIRVIRRSPRAGELREGRRGGRDLLSLIEGIDSLDPAIELVTKLDADVTMPPGYFERIADAFVNDPRLGIASGSRQEPVRGEWQQIHLTGTAVEAQCRTYRRACWDAVQPLEPCLGWDGIDEARAVVAGWRTLVVPRLGFRHHRPMGSSDGHAARARAAVGIAAYHMGFRPSYLLLRALWQTRRDRYSLFMLWGWAGAMLGPDMPSAELAARRHVRGQQSARHLAHRFREVRGGRRSET
jgi:glycosyltransferase involved in cell wall biosynthesis